MKILLSLLSLLIIANSCKAQLEPVNELDLNKYRGRWYQVYASLFTNLTQQRNAVCTTADYNLVPDGSVSVFNANRVNTSQGPANNISGFAYATNRTGVFTVILNRPNQNSSRGPNYFVYKLGPKTFGVENRYEYAIVSSPSRRNIYILARNASDFAKRFRNEVFVFLNENGLNDPLNPILQTYHGSDCGYPKRREILPVNKIDLKKYVGRWYKTYISTYSFNQTKSFCGTVDYSPLPDNTLAAYYSENTGQPGGRPYAVPGITYPTNRTGIFKVALQGIERMGDYWVIKLGPETFGQNGFYEYSIVSEPSKFTLTVLVRNLESFSKYDAEIRKFLDNEGFNDPKNPYLLAVHTEKCVYP